LKRNFSVSTCCCSGEAVGELEHRLPPDRVQCRELGRRLLGAGRLGHLGLRLPAAVRAKVIHGEVVGDAEEPRRERRRLPAELADRLEHLQKRLRRQVLCVVLVADAHVEVAVDAVEVNKAERFERLAIPQLRAIDERATRFRLALLLARSLRRGSRGKWCPARQQTPPEPKPTRLSRARRFTNTTFGTWIV
jgi:hypothetical protein